MRRNLLKKALMIVVFISILLTTLLDSSFLSEATARISAPTATVSITPESGHVGDVIRVIGEIDTTDGPYLIFFDQEEVKNGTATGTAVNDTFIVPPRPMGNYTITLHDVTTEVNYTSSELFTLQTAYFIKAVVPSPPEQLQEGESAEILTNVTGGIRNTCYVANITVTAPDGAVYYNDTLQLTNTTNTGCGEGDITYPADFSLGAHTNYTGTYNIAFNETLATTDFTVGLTDKLEYRRIDRVHIRGAGYEADEIVTVDLTIAEESVAGFPQNITAGADGVVAHTWEIPDNAKLGTYSVTLNTATSEGTAKSVPDVQSFAIVFIPLNESRPLLDPSRGSWDDQVRLIGEIETSGGDYTILWDGERIEGGRCVPNSGVVNDTLTVPISDKGNHEIALYDNSTKTISLPSVFEVATSCYVSAMPSWILEGDNTTITVGLDEAQADATYIFMVNVTDPAGQPHRISRTIEVDGMGSGEESATYWSDFTDTDANTDYVGTCDITVITVNKTLATGNFTIGLTDKPEYVRRYLSEGKEKTSEAVIHGSGYINETVTINISYYSDTSLVPVEGYPKEENASDGLLTHLWEIPDNATLATYYVTLTAAAIDKSVKDAQNFTIIEIIVSCQVQNKYDNNSLAGVSVTAYLGPLGSFFIDNRTTNATGQVDFLLDRGYYSFGAYWREVEVGSLSLRNTTGDTIDYVLRVKFHIKCELAPITMIVSDKEGPLPFINVTLTNATSAPKEIPSFQTDYAGVISTNAFTNTVYRIEARRYGHLFFNHSIGNLTETVGNLIKPFQIPCPTYTLFIHASDSKERPIQNATIEVIEWSSGRIAGAGKTDEWGSIRLDCTFGRYKVRVYNYTEMLGQTVILNETVVDLIRDQFYLVLHCRTVSLDLSLKVTDHFRRPIPNAMVKIEREDEEILSLTTGPDGIASRHEILGGDYRISLYVRGRLCGVKSLYLDESREIAFQVGDFVMVGGYPLEFNQLITGISLTILAVFSGLTLTYIRRSKKS